jgi:hypothetical protein
MSSKIIGKETFNINDRMIIECEKKRTRSGVRENATVIIDGEPMAEGTYFWSNRPWYRFTYENAIRNALEKTKQFDEEQITNIMEGLHEKNLEKLDGLFKTVTMVAKLGEVLTENKKEQNDWKKRMLSAGLSGLDFPDDWDSLSEEEKEKRLNRVLEVKA